MGKLQIPNQVDLAKVRSNALQTIIITLVAVLTTEWWIMGLLAIDFFIRGFMNPKWSILSRISGRFFAKVLPFGHKLIFFPPKQFAARVGFGFSIVAAGLMFSGYLTAGILVAVTLVVFASLECFLNICMGCIVYDAVIAPRRNRNYSKGR